MKFGLFYEWPNPELRDWKTLFEEGMEQIRYSEEMGFDYVLVAEHHFSNYGNSPAPLLQAMAIAERTKRLQIATAVLVLPIWNPLRLAEEVAVLDNLSGGRFICGIGRGFQPHEMSRFDIDLPDSRQIFLESLEVMVKAWTQDESFTYDGEYVKVNHPTTVWPKPLQKPHPKLWVAGTSVETMELAAKWDMMPITTSLFGTGGVRSHVASFVQALKAEGKDYRRPDVAMQSVTQVAPSQAEALEELHHARWQIRAGRALNRLEVTDGRVASGPFQGELDETQLQETLFFGDPDQVIEKFRAASELGVTHVSNWMMFGNIPHEKIMRSIKLMGEHVIPALRDVEPPMPLYDELVDAPPTTNAELQAARFRGPSPSDVT